MSTPSRFRRGTVTHIVLERPGLQRVQVDGAGADVLTELVGPVETGDAVVLNLRPVELGLAEGCTPVVHWNLARREWKGASGGHVLKLRYTSFQVDTGVAEEFGAAGAWPRDLAGTIVAVCAEHDQVAAVVEAFHVEAPDSAVAYVMTDGGALPLALSDGVAELRERALLVGTVTTGHAFGGAAEAVNATSGLVVARHTFRPDLIVVSAGPTGRAGAVGAALAAARALDAVAALAGEALLVTGAGPAVPILMGAAAGGRFETTASPVAAAASAARRRYG